MELKNFDKLVQSITSNILEKFELKTTNHIYEKSCLILVPKIGFGMKNYYTFIKSELPEYNLYLGKDKNLSDSLYSVTNNINLINIDFEDDTFVSTLDKVERIVVVGLKISQMNELIEAKDDDYINHLILGAHMANKHVTILLNTNQIMYKKIYKIISELRAMGIHVMNIQHKRTGKQKAPLEKNTLITEDFVTKLGKQGSKVIVLHKKQLVTPLAKDKLRELKIEIKYVEEDK